MESIEELEKHWRIEPPVGLLVAAFMGFKRPSTTDSTAVPGVAGNTTTKPGGNAVDLLKMFPSGKIQ